MKNILYVGPSWAKRSFDTVEGSEAEYTNLLKELDIDATDLSKLGSSNIGCLDRIHAYKGNVDAILWVYCEPINDVLHENKKSLVESENFWTLRKEMNHFILDSISELNVPVGLIGAHSDIFDCNYKNITVIHDSWQKFLAKKVGVHLVNGWGADVAHRYAMYEFKESKPSHELVEHTSDTLQAWTKMELLGVFRGVHPNRKGNELFAQEIKNSVQSFINNL